MLAHNLIKLVPHQISNFAKQFFFSQHNKYVNKLDIKLPSFPIKRSAI